MADSTNTTMQVLNFINAKVDSAMPTIKAGVSGAIQATEKYGTSWAKFRAWEYATSGISFMALTMFSLGLMYFTYKLAKTIEKPSKAFNWRYNSDEDKDGPKSLLVVILCVISFLIFLVGIINTICSLPRGIAAVMEPQGFAVQMLIDGIKK